MSYLLYEIPGSFSHEIDELDSHVADFMNNTISESDLKSKRVPFGIYEQRQKGTYMVRVRCAAGIITPTQLKRVAELSLIHASGILHVTTRQEIQIHDVAIENLVVILRELVSVGLSTRGGGGNTVRNITAPWDSGIAANETFDVTPYAIALTSAMMAREDSWLLPRKYKIAFSNSDLDTAFATVSDLGFIARIKDGVRGFKVYVAGGMGKHSQPGHILHDFIPDSDVFLTAETVKRLFSKHGNRQNRHVARLRFLWNTLGGERFKFLYHEEKERLISEGLTALSAHEIPNVAVSQLYSPLSQASQQGFDLWSKRYTTPQKQPGSASVKVPLLFGILEANKALEIAEAVAPFGENTIRFTLNQNMTLRNIPFEYLVNIYAVSQKTTTLSNSASVFGNAIACTGASTCQLGICRSRGALNAVVNRLKASSIPLDDLSELQINISGCSNGCGRHLIADLGFFGKMGEKDLHRYPVYAIVTGAIFDGNGNSRFAEKIDEISAKDLPALVEELALHYSAIKSAYVDFASYMKATGCNLVQEICDRLRNIPSFDADGSYYRDWDEGREFSLDKTTPSQLSAGLFDQTEKRKGA